MEVRLTPDQEAFIRRLAAVDVAEDSLARGEGRSITTQQSARELATEVKQRGRARLAAERKAPQMPHRLAPQVEAELDEDTSREFKPAASPPFFPAP